MSGDIKSRGARSEVMVYKEDEGGCLNGALLMYSNSATRHTPRQPSISITDTCNAIRAIDSLSPLSITLPSTHIHPQKSEPNTLTPIPLFPSPFHRPSPSRKKTLKALRDVEHWSSSILALCKVTDHMQSVIYFKDLSSLFERSRSRVLVF